MRPSRVTAGLVAGPQHLDPLRDLISHRHRPTGEVLVAERRAWQGLPIGQATISAGRRACSWPPVIPGRCRGPNDGMASLALMARSGKNWERCRSRGIYGLMDYDPSFHPGTIPPCNQGAVFGGSITARAMHSDRLRGRRAWAAVERSWCPRFGRYIRYPHNRTCISIHLCISSGTPCHPRRTVDVILSSPGEVIGTWMLRFACAFAARATLRSVHAHLYSTPTTPSHAPSHVHAFYRLEASREAFRCATRWLLSRSARIFGFKPDRGP